MTIERVVPAAERNPNINGFGIRGPSDDGMPWGAREELREVAEDVIRDRRIQADAPPATAKPLSTTISNP
jgi:hypothetical protein